MTGARPLRSDAERNRGRLLAAADTVFAERGTDAGVELIAREAGVGVGTLYRHFPTKQALIDELVHSLARQVLACAREALDLPPEEGLDGLLLAVGELQTKTPDCADQLWRQANIDDTVLPEFRRMVAVLLERAQEAGRIRKDVAVTDISMLIWASQEIGRLTREIAPDAWRRHLELVIAGLRPGGDPLRQTPLTAEQVAVITARR